MLANTNAALFSDIFSELGQCFRPAQRKSLENQKSRFVRIILDKYGIFSKYFKPLHKSVVGCRRATDRQHSEITDRQTFFLDLSDSCLYVVHLGLGPFSGSCKNSGNIGLLKSKPKAE